MKQEIRAGLIGYGFAGRTFHAPVLLAVPGLKLTKVVERSGHASKEHYPWVETVRSADELYQDNRIDLIIVATPSTQHGAFVKKALLAGKHVVVEKPFTFASSEADELIRLAENQGVLLSVFHNRRWDGDFLTIQQLIREGLLGEVTEAEFRWENYRPASNPVRWRENGEPGSGTFYDLGIHFLDQALTLFGEPTAVRADIRRQRAGAMADDYFDVTLHYDTGLRVTLKSSMLVRDPGPRYTLHGSRGTFVKYGIDPQEDALKQGLDPSVPAWGEEPPEKWGKIHTSLGGLNISGCIETYPGSYASYYSNIYEHLTGTAELAVKPEQARAAVRLVELAYQSSKEQRTIDLSEL